MRRLSLSNLVSCLMATAAAATIIVAVFSFKTQLLLTSSTSSSSLQSLRRLSSSSIPPPPPTTTTTQWTPNPTTTTTINNIRPYNYLDIEKSASMFEGYYARVLLFDGDDFSWWSMMHKNTTSASAYGSERSFRAVPLLIHALRKHFPERFRKGAPPFQVMTSDGDAVNLGMVCTSTPNKCHFNMNLMPPLLAHGSVPTRWNDFPFITAYPNWCYGHCLYDYKVRNKRGSCDNPWLPMNSILQRTEEESLQWNDLIPTLVWRGADNAFLTHIDEYHHSANSYRNGESMIEHIRENSTQEELVADLINKTDRLTPRWRAVVMTVQEDLELLQLEQQQQQHNRQQHRHRWIDVRFVDTLGNGPYHAEWNKHGVKVNTDGTNMEPNVMASYKYQIDFGGGGGTTWRGTLAKLAMPGVLFHHETLMSDWFYFHDGLFVPWKHYIPVSWDLSNLKERYDWAEANPDRCQEISKAATELVKYLMSEEYMDTLYEHLYKDHLGRIIDAYQPTELETQKAAAAAVGGGGGADVVQQHIRTIYDTDGFTFRKVLQCAPDQEPDQECELVLQQQQQVVAEA